MARGDDGTRPVSRDELRRRAHDLFAGLRGRVLEVGAGDGENLDAFGASVSWTGIEPDAVSRRHLQVEARRHDFVDQVLDARCENLPFAADSFDAVVATLVFCSVTDLDGSLAEVMRVLKPGGTLACVEHVHAPKGARRVIQSLATPLSARWDGNCHWNRDPVGAARRAGFLGERLETFELDTGVPFLPAPCVVYVGVKPSA
ncbi:class I SAM-dependent methyltransferase [Diaminobutyricibacter sp. McL0618]|uniref:class I SAM-dependent methyltransferase n=1 Tax=Leifsonia sp. McL0618 TaxID=3415677 RepID=UPI003CE83FC3